ncbi:MAG: hypothetical protein A2341_07890 [Deltaproteobacteria bacterium RIFOXYB12_FULL_58_9]|nr:MAG: hypothetical protein A2341_07890 [Deltaproteobacteria bacterium RIFOXYB12_FULL_58_9]
MAKSIVVTHNGKQSIFGFAKLDRKKLYPSRKRVVLDNDEQPCIRAELTRDGSILFHFGMTGQGYFCNDGKWVPNSTLVGLDDQGKVVEQQPSTLGEPQDLEGPVEPEELLDLSVLAVYMLDPENLDQDLQKEIEAGKIFRFGFNYRADFHRETGYLVANDRGWFAIVGNPIRPEWCELEKPAAATFEDDDDNAGLDLDFDMT